MILEALKKIIEASSSELAVLDTGSDIFLENFKSARRAYFLNDVLGLKKHYDFFKANGQGFAHAELCAEIIKCRIAIREKNISSQSDVKVYASDSFFDKAPNDNLIQQIFLVELLAVEAILCDLSGDSDLSYQKNKMASVKADSLGMKKKSSTLLYNGIVAINHKTPAQQLRICNLTDAINKAEACEDHNTVIAALTSLSQEYEALGCLNLAYEECSKAMVLAKKHCFGSFNFCSVLLIGIKLSAQIGNLDLALENLKLVETFDFKELEEEVMAAKALIDSQESAETLSGDEQKLIQLLTTSPKDKYFLIERLYGSGDSESLDNRLKQLFLRLRKKRKGLVTYNKKNCVYELMH